MNSSILFFTLLVTGLYSPHLSGMLTLCKATKTKPIAFQIHRRALSLNKDFLQELKKKQRLPQFTASLYWPRFYFNAPFPYPYGYLRHLPDNNLQEACRKEYEENPLSTYLFCLNKFLEWAHYGDCAIDSELLHKMIKNSVHKILCNQSSDMQKSVSIEAIDTYKNLGRDYDLKGTKINLIPKEVRLPETDITLQTKGHLTIKFSQGDLYPYAYLDLIDNSELKIACREEKAKAPWNMNLLILNNQLEQAHHDGKRINYRNADVIEHTIDVLLKDKSNNTKKCALKEVALIASILNEQS